MTLKLKTLLILNVIILALSRFLIPLYMLYKMWGLTNISLLLCYIAAGAVSIWIGPIIARIALLLPLDKEETKWLKTELLKQELKDKLGI